ncbi:hypothetical protein GGX14DRAFT_387400 [Mycena pura]|uniref:Uncharacterized protein n=1 Tax=Mycena pura TaxID=153505 RepID=A0AAD6YLK8_9AGAR|nr:hypothetical protein GGX14DRAFT_387400 [Mycena pura]
MVASTTYNLDKEPMVDGLLQAFWLHLLSIFIPGWTEDIRSSGNCPTLCLTHKGHQDISGAQISNGFLRYQGDIWKADFDWIFKISVELILSGNFESVGYLGSRNILMPLMTVEGQRVDLAHLNTWTDWFAFQRTGHGTPVPVRKLWIGAVTWIRCWYVEGLTESGDLFMAFILSRKYSFELSELPDSEPEGHGGTLNAAINFSDFVSGASNWFPF